MNLIYCVYVSQHVIHLIFAAYNTPLSQTLHPAKRRQLAIFSLGSSGPHTEIPKPIRGCHSLRCIAWPAQPGILSVLRTALNALYWITEVQYDATNGINESR